MKRSRISIGAVGLAVLACLVMSSFAEEPAINPVRIATRQINVYGTNPLQIHSTNVSVTAAQINAAGGGSTAALTPTTVVASGKVTSYGYPIVVGDTNTSTKIYMTQAGTLSYVLAGQTSTNTFPTTFIATPVVTWSVDVSQSTNNPSTLTIASNAFTVSNCQTTGQWIAHGRLK
jgi:hypothetical protein